MNLFDRRIEERRAANKMRAKLLRIEMVLSNEALTEADQVAIIGEIIDDC